jgi:hypothetical protein
MYTKNQKEDTGRKGESESPDPIAAGTTDTMLTNGLTIALGNILWSRQEHHSLDEYRKTVRELDISQRDAQRLIAAAKAVDRCDGVSQLLRKALHAASSLPGDTIVEQINVQGQPASPPRIGSAVLGDLGGDENAVDLDRDVYASPKALITYNADIELILKRWLASSNTKRLRAYMRKDGGHYVVDRIKRVRRRLSSKGS